LRVARAVQWGLVALVVLSSFAQSIPAQNDAGSGADASDVQSVPTPIPDYGTYAGTSRSVNDADWYAVTNSTTSMASTCTVLDATGDTYEGVTLGIATTSASHSVTSTLPADGALSLVLAGVAPTSVQVGLVPVPNPAGSTPARPGSYQFSIRGYTSADLGMGDAGLGAGVDAPAWPDAVPLEGPCTRGTLTPLGGIGDTSDAYAFTLPATTQIVYTLASPTDVTLSVLDSAGQTVSGSAIAPGQIGDLTLAAGTFYLNASAASGTTLDYMIGIVGGDPTGPGCKPACLTS